MIPQQTFETYEVFGDNATKTAPDSAKYAAGFQESDVLPAEWMNWAWNKNTKGITDLNTGVTSIEAELGNVVTAGGKTPTESNNTQVITAIKYLIAQAKAQAILEAHPVGSLYWTSSTENPNKTFGGGTWSQIKDRFVLAAGDSYKQGVTGGSATITLTTAQLPSHSHSIAHTHSFTPVGTIKMNAHTHTLNNHTHSFTPTGTLKNGSYTFKGTTITGAVDRVITPFVSDKATVSGCFSSTTQTYKNQLVNDGWTVSRLDYVNVVINFSATPAGTITVATQPTFTGTAGTTGSNNNNTSSTTTTGSFTGTAGTTGNTTTKFTGTAGTTSSTQTKFTGTAGTTGASSATNSGATGSGSSINKMPPYIVEYCWIRTA